MSWFPVVNASFAFLRLYLPGVKADISTCSLFIAEPVQGTLFLG